MKERKLVRVLIHPLWRFLIASVLVLMGCAAVCLAQQEDAARSRISDAISKSDFTSAVKLLSGLQGAAGGEIKSSTRYEEIKACGFYPQETRLECVIEVKRPNGYGGPIGSPGSMEHVAFCIDFDNNGTFAPFEYAGQGSVQMHDESAGASPPWHYAVYRDFNPFGGLRTSNAGSTTTTVTNGPTRRVRAILSWFLPPARCDFVPVWGNVFEFRIRFDPIR